MAKAGRRGEEDEAGPGSSSASSPPSTGSDSNPFGLEEAAFEPPDDPESVGRRADELDDEYEPPPREPIEWTPERATFLIKGGGLLLHTADGVSREPGGDQLWRATEQDCADMGPPLSRILNRYAPARRLAGYADEGELAFGMLAYAKRNLRLRGEILTARDEREPFVPQADFFEPQEEGRQPPPGTIG